MFNDRNMDGLTPVYFHIPTTLKERLSKSAKARGTSQKQLVAEALDVYLNWVDAESPQLPMQEAS